MLSILITLLGIVVIVAFAILVFRTAADTGRSPLPWALLTAGVGLALQFVLPILIGIVIGVYHIVSGKPLDELAVSLFGLGFVIDISCLILSIVGMMSVSKQVLKIPDDPQVPFAPPPPPPQF
jgi:hypothetical protein